MTKRFTYKIYIITPNDHMSHDLSYFSGPKTSGAADTKAGVKESNGEKCRAKSSITFLCLILSKD